MYPYSNRICPFTLHVFTLSSSANLYLAIFVSQENLPPIFFNNCFTDKIVLTSTNSLVYGVQFVCPTYSYFEKGCRKMSTRPVPKSNCGIRSSLFLTLTTLVVEPTFVAFLLTVAIICPWPPACHNFKFLWRTVNSKPPTIPFATVACTFSNNVSQNSCRKKLQNVYGPFRSCVGNWGEFQI